MTLNAYPSTNGMFPDLEIKVMELVAQGNYSAYTICVIAWDDTNKYFTATQTANALPTGNCCVIQKATTTSDRKTWGIVRGETSTATDLSGVASLAAGERVQSAASGAFARASAVTNRTLGIVTDLVNDKVYFDGLQK